MIHEELVSFETAKLAKEKGFDVPTAEFYNEDGNVGCYPRAFPHNEFPDGDYAAPTQSLLQRWLREEKNIVVVVDWFSIERKYYWSVFNTTKSDIFASFIPPSRSMSRYDTWEQALENGLEYALKELK